MIRRNVGGASLNIGVLCYVLVFWPRILLSSRVSVIVRKVGESASGGAGS